MEAAVVGSGVEALLRAGQRRDCGRSAMPAGGPEERSVDGRAGRASAARPDGGGTWGAADFGSGGCVHATRLAGVWADDTCRPIGLYQDVGAGASSAVSSGNGS